MSEKLQQQQPIRVGARVNVRGSRPPPPNPFLPLVIYVDAPRCAQFPSCKCKVKPLQMLIDRRRRHRRPSATRPLQNTLQTSHREGGEIASYTIFHANYKL